MRRIIFAALLVCMGLTLAPVSAQQGVTYYVNVKAAKVRAEPKANARVVTTLGRNKPVVVLEVVIGDTVSNVSTWYKVNASGKEGYILSSLLVDQAPATANTSAGNGSTNSGSKPAATPTSAPVSVIPPAAGVSCGGARVCGDMTSCAQAYACLNAGNRRLDADHDGVPCETICPGG